MDDLVLPRYTNVLWVLGAFLVALVVFHLLLIRWVPLDNIEWKKVDYIWLSLALLGVIGGAGAARQDAAVSIASTAQSRLEFAAKQVESGLSFGRGPAICRTFLRTKMLAPPEVVDRIQRKFDEQCKWFRIAAERLQGTPFGKREVLHLEDLGVPPEGGDKWAITSLHDSIQQYNEGVIKVQELAASMQHSDAEKLLIAFGPFLLALALALQITKVTREIKLETPRSSPEPQLNCGVGRRKEARRPSPGR